MLRCQIHNIKNKHINCYVTDRKKLQKLHIESLAKVVNVNRFSNLTSRPRKGSKLFYGYLTYTQIITFRTVIFKQGHFLAETGTWRFTKLNKKQVFK